MSHVILLNGCSSAGKTSLAKAIQEHSAKLWLTLGVDTFMDMIPQSKQGAYVTFTKGQNEHGPTMRVESGPIGHTLWSMMPPFAAMLAAKGHNLIIDEVLLDAGALYAYVKALQNHVVYYVGVVCDLATMQERERQRQDRSIGLSNDQILRVHHGVFNAYDLTVDTTVLSPTNAALQILQFIERTPTPSAFSQLASKVPCHH